jgi:anaerobic selenocysteine-containing dehydrogenase
MRADIFSIQSSKDGFSPTELVFRNKFCSTNQDSANSAALSKQAGGYSMVDYQPLNRFPGTRKEFDRQLQGVCQECTVGCGLAAFLQDDIIVDVQGIEQHPVSRGRLCSRGIAFTQGLRHTRRITLPASRNTLTQSFDAAINWEKALDLFAERLRRLRDRESADALVIGCDPEAGLDFWLGARRFARLWGTPHVYHPWDSPEATQALPLKTPAAPCTHWIDSACLLLVESDLAATHPVAFGWVLDAQNQGAKLIVVDSRFTATMSKADLSVIIRPGSGNLFGLWLMKAILEENRQQAQAVADHFELTDDWQPAYDSLSWEGLETGTGLSHGALLNVSRFLDGMPSAFVITGKRLEHLPSHGIWLTLCSAMGWTARPDAGWYPLEAGLPRFNCDSDIELPAAESIPPPAGPFPYQPLDRQGRTLAFRALIASGNCLADFFLPLRTQLKRAELVGFFGFFPNFTCEQSHFVFPAATWAERDSLCFSNDRALQWANRIVAPADACRTGLDFWSGLAQRFGWQEYFPWVKKNERADQAGFYEWLLKRSPDTQGCDLAQIRGGNHLQFWPADPEKLVRRHPPIFVSDSGRLQPVLPAAEIAAKQSPQTEDLFPLAYHSTRVASRSTDAGKWWPWTAELEDEKAVQIHPDIARILGIENGDEVVIAGRRGCIDGRAWLSRMVDRRMIWSPQRLDESRVLVHKKGQSGEDALKLLKANLA